MSEENQAAPAPVTTNADMEMMKLYIQKQESLFQELQRRMISAELNADIRQAQLNNLNQQLASQENYIKQANESIKRLSMQNRELEEKIKVQGASDAEISAVKRDRDQVVRQRDDYFRELQHHIQKCNALTKELEAAKGVQPAEDKKKKATKAA